MFSCGKKSDYKYLFSILFLRWWSTSSIFVLSFGFCASAPLIADAFAFPAEPLESLPMKTLAQELGSPSDLAWQAWLLLENKPNNALGLDFSNMLRRITPKSIFIAPDIISCPKGHTPDFKGACQPDAVKIDAEAQLHFYLNRLKLLSQKGGWLKNKTVSSGNIGSGITSGPLQVSIPIAISKPSYESQISDPNITPLKEHLVMSKIVIAQKKPPSHNSAVNANNSTVKPSDSIQITSVSDALNYGYPLDKHESNGTDQVSKTENSSQPTLVLFLSPTQFGSKIKASESPKEVIDMNQEPVMEKGPLPHSELSNMSSVSNIGPLENKDDKNVTLIPSNDNANGKDNHIIQGNLTINDTNSDEITQNKPGHFVDNKRTDELLESKGTGLPTLEEFIKPFTESIEEATTPLIGDTSSSTMNIEDGEENEMTVIGPTTEVVTDVPSTYIPTEPDMTEITTMPDSVGLSQTMKDPIKLGVVMPTSLVAMTPIGARLTSTLPPIIITPEPVNYLVNAVTISGYVKKFENGKSETSSDNLTSTKLNAEGTIFSDFQDKMAEPQPVLHTSSSIVKFPEEPVKFNKGYVRFPLDEVNSIHNRDFKSFYAFRFREDSASGTKGTTKYHPEISSISRSNRNRNQALISQNFDVQLDRRLQKVNNNSNNNDSNYGQREKRKTMLLKFWTRMPLKRVPEEMFFSTVQKLQTEPSKAEDRRILNMTGEITTNSKVDRLLMVKGGGG